MKIGIKKMRETVILFGKFKCDTFPFKENSHLAR